MASYEFDIHTHSIASGHGTCATMTDMAKAANAAGLKMLGISDHGPKTLGGGRILISAALHLHSQSVSVLECFTAQR